MNDRHRQDVENRFDDLMRDIDEMQVAGEDDTAELRSIVRRLAMTDLSNRSRIRSQLYHQLKHTRNTHRLHIDGGNNTMNIPLKRSVATVAALIALMISVPVLAVMAQTILGQVGSVTITDEQEDLPSGGSITVDQMDVTPTPIAPDARDNVQIAPITNLDGAIATNLSAEDAAAIAGFDLVREPSVLPAGYEFGGRVVFDGASTTVNSFWQRANSPDSVAHVSISQSTGDLESTYRVGPQARLTDVTFGNTIAATFITDANLSDSDGLMYNLLLWEEGGYLYVMTGSSLSAAEMLALAESMYR